MADNGGMKPKDFISIGISMLALIISTASTWFNVLLQKDDIRVIIGDAPSVEILKGGNVEVSGSFDLTIVNAGNTVVGITGILAPLIKLSSNDKPLPNCPSEAALPLMTFVFKGMTIKPSEIVALNLKLTFPTAKKGKGVFGTETLIIGKKIFEAHKGDIYLACLAFNIVTTDGLARQSTIPAYVYTFGDADDPGNEEPLFSNTEPVVMFKRNTTVLTR
jgi:hypothetical protein